MVVLLNILMRLEPIIIISLFFSFFIMFGLPAYQKYKMEDVIVKEIKKFEDPLESPAVTVCLEYVSFELSLPVTYELKSCEQNRDFFSLNFIFGIYNIFLMTISTNAKFSSSFL